MADVESTPTPAAEATPKKASPKKAAKKTTKAAGDSKAKKSSHPPTAVMVSNAIKNLKDRGGSSLQAIKKYVAATYKVDAEKLAPFIRKYLKASVASGELIQTKGKGASGSFKLATADKKATKAPVKPKPAKKPKAAAPKAAAVAPKKPVAKPRKAPAKKPVAKKAVAAPKAKKTAKPPTKKPKSPKAKTTKPKPTKGAKKASPKKK